MTLDERNVTIESGGLRLEGRLHAGSAALAALVLHPHPQYGGDMDNHVVIALCEEFAALGATVLRFNTRGAGRSEGVFDYGRGERDDTRAALALLRHRAAPGASLILAGYSFGAMIAAAVSDDARAGAIVLVSPPAGAPLPLPDAPPALLITGERDSVAPPAALSAFAAPGRTIVTVAGADHGWWPGVDDLRAHVRSFAQALVLAAG
jgi:alpha/beta superfamily hydrolase